MSQTWAPTAGTWWLPGVQRYPANRPQRRRHPACQGQVAEASVRLILAVNVRWSNHISDYRLQSTRMCRCPGYEKKRYSVLTLPLAVTDVGYCRALFTPVCGAQQPKMEQIALHTPAPRICIPQDGKACP